MTRLREGDRVRVRSRTDDGEPFDLQGVVVRHDGPGPKNYVLRLRDGDTVYARRKDGNNRPAQQMLDAEDRYYGRRRSY